MNWSSFLQRLGFRSYVKLPEKGFEELTPKEFSMMIDAYLNGENSAFEENALEEFTLMDYKNANIQEMKKKLCEINHLYRNENQPWGWDTHWGKLELKNLMEDLNYRKKW